MSCSVAKKSTTVLFRHKMTVFYLTVSLKRIHVALQKVHLKTYRFEMWMWWIEVNSIPERTVIHDCCFELQKSWFNVINYSKGRMQSLSFVAAISVKCFRFWFCPMWNRSNIAMFIWNIQILLYICSSKWVTIWRCKPSFMFAIALLFWYMYFAKSKWFLVVVESLCFQLSHHSKCENEYLPRQFHL